MLNTEIPFTLSLSLSRFYFRKLKKHTQCVQLTFE